VPRTLAAYTLRVKPNAISRHVALNDNGLTWESMRLRVLLPETSARVGVRKQPTTILDNPNYAYQYFAANRPQEVFPHSYQALNKIFSAH